MKIPFKENKRYPLFILSGLLLIAIVFSAVQIIGATAPNPGHSWDEMDCDNNLCVNTITNKVGIGVTNPQQKLHSTGYVRADSGFCIGTSCITSWPTGNGGGTVTSISAGAGLTASPNPITTTGTISLNTAAISTCTDGTNHKIYWDSTNNRLRCGTDRMGTPTLSCYTASEMCTKASITEVACDSGYLATGAGWLGSAYHMNYDYPSPDNVQGWLFVEQENLASYSCFVRCCKTF